MADDRLPVGAELAGDRALSPRECFAAGIAAINQWTRKTKGRDFDRLTEAERVKVLKTLEGGKADLGEFDGAPINATNAEGLK